MKLLNPGDDLHIVMVTNFASGRAYPESVWQHADGAQKAAAEFLARHEDVDAVCAVFGTHVDRVTFEKKPT